MNHWPTRVGQDPPSQIETREARLLNEIKKGFSEVTLALILTGVAIGFTSAVGNALGAIFVERYITRRTRERRRR